MGSNKRKSKVARKRAGSAKIPAWFFDRHVPVHLKREVEDALARHAADNGITVGSAKFRSLTLQDLCASLKLVHARWRGVGPEMMQTSAQPGVKALATHLVDCKRKKKMVEQMIADLQAAADDDSSSSRGSAEEGEDEDEDEDAQAVELDGEPAVPSGAELCERRSTHKWKPAYVEGNPRELIDKPEEGTAADQGAKGAEGAAAKDEEGAADGQISGVAEQILSNIEAQFREAGEGHLRITTAELSRWGQIGEWCKRVEFHYSEFSRAELELRKMLECTPLTYSCARAKDLKTPRDTSSSQSEPLRSGVANESDRGPSSRSEDGDGELPSNCAPADERD